MWQGFVRWFSPEARGTRAWHMAVTALGLIVVLVLLGNGLYGLFTHINQANALNAKARLDAALLDATTRLKAPPTLVQPIRSQEQQVSATTDGSLASWQHATQEYTRLSTQVDGIRATPPAQARALAQQNLDQFAAAVVTLAQGKTAEVAGYQGRLQQAQSSFASAQSTSEYFLVAGFAQDQVAAIAAYQPTLAQLQQLTTLVTTEQKLLAQITGSPQPAPLLCADGWGNTPAYYWTTYDEIIAYPQPKPGSQPVEAQWLAQDQALFHAANSARDYAQLTQALTGQIAQVQATNAALVPSIAAKYLADFKADITAIQSYQSNIPTIRTTFQQMYDGFARQGHPVNYNVANLPLKDFSSNIAAAQKLYDADAHLLSDTPTINDYTAAIKQIQKDRGSIKFQVTYATTYNDIVTLGRLIAQGQAHTTHNPADGKDYPDAYEYADWATGIGDVINPTSANLGRLFNANTTQDYQYVDLHVQMFITNISAMLKNLDDPLTKLEYQDKTKGWSQAHQTDMDLIQHYGITHGKIMVVSLREQVARLYDNGQLVKAVQVTTGAPELPSVPGINCTLDKEYNTIFKSPDPPGSPHYYEPTPVNYAMIYHLYGYEVHDAWWRNEFGLYTNLPHHDPAAFNGGSHGCVNISTADMRWLMAPGTGWLAGQDHTPVLIY
jgi:L,D-transpeptidase-like protein